MSFPQDPVVKIILIGDAGVGKTSFFTSFADGQTMSNYIPTIGVDFRLKRISLDTGQQVKLQIWDSAGQERFRSLTSSYFKGADVICLVYDITSRQSFHNLLGWLQFIQKTTHESFLYIIIGNKSDLSPAHRQVSEEEGATFSASLSGGFFETSAKTALHVGEVFDFLTKEIMSRGTVKYVPRVISLVESDDTYKRMKTPKQH